MNGSWAVRSTAAAVVALVGVFWGCGGADMDGTAPTRAFLNAKIWTGDPNNPLAEALLIGGDRLLAVGTSAEIRPLLGDAEVIDATGRFIVPGFIDSHVHFLDGGFRLSSVQLRDATTPEEFTQRIGDFAASVPPGTWITGGDWDHQLWGGELPHREWIDAVTSDHPVWVTRLDGHMSLANTLALELAGVDRSTEEIEGGTIVRDTSGEPTGVFKDNATVLIEDAIPPPSDVLYDRALEAAMSYVAEQGVTSVHHMGTWKDLDVFRRAQAEGRLRTRIYAAVPLDTWERLAELMRSAEAQSFDDWLAAGLLKGFVDGSLGSHTAAFHAPYDDQPTDRGLLVNTEEDLSAWITGADAAGLQVAVHAIGDRANQQLLDIYAQVGQENGPRDRRFRIEHAQHLRQEDIRRFAELDVIASMQPYHAIDDGRWAEKLIGPVRIQTTYAFRSLLDAGATLCFGSDWFVAPPVPLVGIYAATTRRTTDGANPDGWVPSQKVSVEEALLAYTGSAAYASFQQGDKGMLKKGYLADFAVIDRDLTRIPLEDILDAAVVMTVVGGKIVFEN